MCVHIIYYYGFNLIIHRFSVSVGEGCVVVEEYYLGWINQLEEALDKWGSVSVPGRYRSIVVTGMGGSGIVGDYVAVLSNVYGGLPVIVSKSHLVPEYISSDDLVFVISYSGNTLETRIAYKRVLEKGARIVVVSSDGLLEEEARRRGLPFIGVVKGIAPRTALPYMLYGVLGVLDSSGYSIVSKSVAEEAYRFIAEYMGEVVDTAYRLAGFIAENKGLLILAGHTPYEALLIRGKNEFNENSKIPVKVEVAPEWMHNDIVGWEDPFENKYSVVAVKDPGDKTGCRLVDFMTRIYERNNIPVYMVELKGDNILEKLLYGSLLFGLASVKLARIRGLDPLKTTSIYEYKSVVNKIFSNE